MSGIGTKRTFRNFGGESAFEGKADNDQPLLTNVGLWVYALAEKPSTGEGLSERVGLQLHSLRHFRFMDGSRPRPMRRRLKCLRLSYDRGGKTFSHED
jgi:hypothetical protein